MAETDPAGRVTLSPTTRSTRLVRKDRFDGSRFLWGYDEGGAGARALGRLTRSRCHRDAALRARSDGDA